jgi:hypothetical protein
MKRRHFLRLSVAGATAAGLQLAGCNPFSADRQSLTQPLTLSQFCDETAILEIGKAYQGMEAIAADAAKLRQALLTDIYGKASPPRDTDAIPMDKINARIRKDYEENLVVTPAGWIISRTEARQCALFALNA